MAINTAPCLNALARYFQLHGVFVRDFLHTRVFKNAGAQTASGARQTAHQLAGIGSASRNFANYTKCSGIIPRDWRILLDAGAAQFPRAGHIKITIDFQVALNLGESFQHVAQTGQITRGRLRESHAPGVAAGAGAHAIGFEYHGGFFRSQLAQVCCRGQSGKSASYDGEVHFCRHSLAGGVEINFPGWIPPTTTGVVRHNASFSNESALQWQPVM